MSQQTKAIVVHGSRDTIVTLLGWAGAADKNVAKYAQIYQKKGYTTVQYTSPPLAKGWGNKNAREVDHLATTLSDVMLNDSNRLLFHIFSMNGFISLCSLDLQYPDLKILEKCDGLFLDSCPAVYVGFSMDNVVSHARVMDHVYNQKISDSNIITATAYRTLKKFYTIKFGTQLFMDHAMINTGIIRIEDVSPYHYILSHPNLPANISMIFSDGDLVCSAKQINEFAEIVKKRTDMHRNVIKTHLTDTAHVEHFRKYPKNYLEQIDDFLQRAEPKSKI